MQLRASEEEADLEAAQEVLPLEVPTQEALPLEVLPEDHTEEAVAVCLPGFGGATTNRSKNYSQKPAKMILMEQKMQRQLKVRKTKKKTGRSMIQSQGVLFLASYL